MQTRHRIKNDHPESLQPQKNKRDPQKKAKMPPNQAPQVSPQERYMIDLQKAQKVSYRSHERTFEKRLGSLDRSKRERIYTWLLSTARTHLELEFRTIELSMKMLDTFMALTADEQSSPKQKVNIYYAEPELKMCIVNCLFLSCKFNEIYPPALEEIMALVGTTKDAKEIIKNEFLIVETLGFTLSLALTEDWYKLQTREHMPCWAYLCYLNFNLGDSSEKIVQRMLEFMQAVNKSARHRELRPLLKSQSGFRFDTETKNLYTHFCYFNRCNQLNKAVNIPESKDD